MIPITTKNWSQLIDVCSWWRGVAKRDCFDLRGHKAKRLWTSDLKYGHESTANTWYQTALQPIRPAYPSNLSHSVKSWNFGGVWFRIWPNQEKKYTTKCSSNVETDKAVYVQNNGFPSERNHFWPLNIQTWGRSILLLYVKYQRREKEKCRVNSGTMDGQHFVNGAFGGWRGQRRVERKKT